MVPWKGRPFLFFNSLFQQPVVLPSLVPLLMASLGGTSPGTRILKSTCRAALQKSPGESLAAPTALTPATPGQTLPGTSWCIEGRGRSSATSAARVFVKKSPWTFTGGCTPTKDHMCAQGVTAASGTRLTLRAIVSATLTAMPGGTCAATAVCDIRRKLAFQNICSPTVKQLGLVCLTCLAEKCSTKSDVQLSRVMFK